MESRANATPDKPFLLFDVEYSRFEPIDFYSTKEEAENKKIEIDKKRGEVNKPLNTCDQQINRNTKK